MAAPGRPYDALYDAATYTVSGARDHYRQQTVAGGFMVARAPNYPNMFSELPHFPASGYKFKNSDKVPAFVDRTFHEQQTSAFEQTTKSLPAQINGQHRYKYFKRPLLAAPEPVIIKQAAALPPPPVLPPVDEPKSKTIGTQSDYRENEAQTTPWDPAYTIPENATVKQQALSAKYNCDGPELLKLRDLKFGDGLPPGLQEVRRIIKLREKRAFEATLPPLSDVDQLPLRQRMLEEWESKEWAEREAEILSVQDERLTLLEQALMAREDEFDEATMRRVEERKAAMLEDRSERFATIQANRIKTMRQLIEARKYVEKPRKLHKLTVVEKYANFGSSTYAPVQRDGRFPDCKPNGKTIETEGFQPATLQGLEELESYLPFKMLNPRIAAPSKPAKLNYQQRQDVAVQRDLKAINDLLDTAKSSKGRGIGECWPAPLKDSADVHKGTRSRSTARNTDRPDTPVLPASSSAGREAAAVLLQRLLRGRAAQNVMYEGKTRCHALIQELSLDGQGATTRPEDHDASDPLDSLIGGVLSTLCAALADNNPMTRAAQLTAIYGPTMAPPRDGGTSFKRSAPEPLTEASTRSAVGVASEQSVQLAPEAAKGSAVPSFERVETKVYADAGQQALSEAVYARVNSMATAVVGTVATEMAAAVAAAVTEAVRLSEAGSDTTRISESGEAAALAEAAAVAAQQIVAATAAAGEEGFTDDAQAAGDGAEQAAPIANQDPSADNAALEREGAEAPAAVARQADTVSAVLTATPPAARPPSRGSRPTSAIGRPSSATAAGAAAGAAFGSRPASATAPDAVAAGSRPGSAAAGAAVNAGANMAATGEAASVSRPSSAVAAADVAAMGSRPGSAAQAAQEEAEAAIEAIGLGSDAAADASVASRPASAAATSADGVAAAADDAVKAEAAAASADATGEVAMSTSRPGSAAAAGPSPGSRPASAASVTAPSGSRPGSAVPAAASRQGSARASEAAAAAAAGGGSRPSSAQAAATTAGSRPGSAAAAAAEAAPSEAEPAEPTQAAAGLVEAEAAAGLGEAEAVVSMGEAEATAATATEEQADGGEAVVAEAQATGQQALGDDMTTEESPVQADAAVPAAMGEEQQAAALTDEAGDAAGATGAEAEAQLEGDVQAGMQAAEQAEAPVQEEQADNSDGQEAEERVGEVVDTRKVPEADEGLPAVRNEEADPAPAADKAFDDEALMGEASLGHALTGANNAAEAAEDREGAAAEGSAGPEFRIGAATDDLVAEVSLGGAGAEPTLGEAEAEAFLGDAAQ